MAAGGPFLWIWRAFGRQSDPVEATGTKLLSRIDRSSVIGKANVVDAVAGEQEPKPHGGLLLWVERTAMRVLREEADGCRVGSLGMRIASR